MIRNLRWYIAGLLMLATTINYLDRQTMAVAFPYFRERLHMSAQEFSYIVAAFTWAYGLMHPVAGRIVDLLKPRLSFAVAVSWWSIASIMHVFAGGVASFAVVRFFLGIGESANFPGAIKSVSEWFPAKERGLATGIFNVGAGLGAIIAPPLVAGWLIPHYGWRSAFVVTGCLGFFWLIPWLLLYYSPAKHPRLTPEESEYIRKGLEEECEPRKTGAKQSGVWKEAICRKELWATMFARFMSDPVWWFYLAWIPDYLNTARGLSLREIAVFAWIPFVAADIGSLVGGAMSALLAKRGMPTLTARKTAMCISAALMPVAIPAVRAHSWELALVFICIAAFGHQSWAASMLTLPTDIFPGRMVAFAYGMTAMAGVVGCSVFTLLVGYLVDRVGYVPVFTLAGIMHPIAAALIVMVVRSGSRARENRRLA